MKRIAVFLLCAVILLCAAACSRRSVANENAAKQTDKAETFRQGFENVTAPPVESDTGAPETAADAASQKRDAAMKAAREYLGETDPVSGLKYTFSFDGTEKNGSKDVVRIRVSVHADDGTYSLCGYLLADADGNVTKSEWE